MPRRIAALIGNQNFESASGLTSLAGPLNDVDALSAVLSDSGLGNFEVRTFRDESREIIMQGLDVLLSEDAARGDLVLIFYAGHGKLNRDGELCLAASNTRLNALYSSSIPASALRKLVSNSYCNSVVLLLDCCHSGAVSSDAMRGSFESQFNWMANEASGFHILTASSAIQTARETDIEGGLTMGRFTRFITEGIRSGAADTDKDGAVTVTDLCQYLATNLSGGQTAHYFAHRASGNPVIASSASHADKQSEAEKDANVGMRRAETKKSLRTSEQETAPVKRPVPLKTKKQSTTKKFTILEEVHKLYYLAIAAVIVVLISAFGLPQYFNERTPENESVSQSIDKETSNQPTPFTLPVAKTESPLVTPELKTRTEPPTVDGLIALAKTATSQVEKRELKTQARALLAEDLNFGSLVSDLSSTGSGEFREFVRTDFKFISYDPEKDELLVRFRRYVELRALDGNLPSPKPAGTVSYDIRLALGKLYRLMPRSANTFELSGDYGVAVWYSNPEHTCEVPNCERYFYGSDGWAFSSNNVKQGNYEMVWFSSTDIPKIRKTQAVLQKIIYEINKL
jgi:uncharacterized caspase-like protein